MKTALCKSILTLAASFALVACSNDSRSADDVLAEDSTLALEVMTANVDSTQIQVDTAEPVAELAPENVPATEPAQMPAPVAAPAPAIAQESPEPRVVRRSTPRRAKKSPSRARPATVRVASRSSATPAARPIPSTPMKSSATIPSGTELSLTSGQRVCASMSNPGDRFAARLSEDLIGPLGVVIPKGTPATAQIFSLEKGVDLRMHSIDFAGHTHSIDSDVTHTDIEKITRKSPANKSRVAAGAGIGAVTGGVIGGSVPGAVIGAAGGAIAGAVTSRRTSRVDYCIPEGGKIAVRLTEPLKLTLSE